MSFTFAMITLPIGTYFFTVNYVFGGMFASHAWTELQLTSFQAMQRMQVPWQQSWQTWC